MVKALQWFQNKQLMAGGQPSVKEMVVAQPGVRERQSEMRKKAVENFSDSLTLEEKEGLGLLGLKHIALETPLANATADWDVKFLLGTGGRGEDVRNLRKPDMGTCHVTGLGLPSGPGADCTTAIMNDGKTIGTSGRKYRRAIPTHRNAAQDAGMALGVNLVLRHNFLQEPVTLPTDLVR